MNPDLGSVIETGTYSDETLAVDQNGAQDVETDFDYKESTIPKQRLDMEISALGSSFETFTLFPKLPAELRLAIWTLTLPGRRYFELRSTLAVDEEDSTDWEITTWHIIGVDKAPVAFFICQESRAEVLKTYTPLKSTDGYPAVLIDFEKDVLCVRWRFYYHSVQYALENISVQDKLRFILTDSNPNETIPPLENEELRHLPALKEILMVDFDEDAVPQEIMGFEELEYPLIEAAQARLGKCESFVQGLFQRNPERKIPKVRTGRVILNPSSFIET